MNRLREFHWRLIKKAVFSEEILTSIRILEGNRLQVQTTTWEDYWRKSTHDLPGKVQKSLLHLKEERRKYLVSTSDFEKKKAYCKAYFVLLDLCLKSSLHENFRRELLNKIVTFETAHVWKEQESSGLMLINNITNPAYLVSRIRYPNVLDDPKYLPLIAKSLGNTNDDATMYYHYRQFAPGKRHPLRLMVYMPVCNEGRFEAFRTYHHFQDSLVSKNDTRSRQRAKIIAEMAIHPILQKMNQGDFPSNQNTLSIADVGGGTGELGRYIFEHLLYKAPEFSDLQIAWEIIDADFKNFQRHVKNRKIGKSLRIVRCKRQDMYEWVTSKPSSPQEKPFDFILLCRILNNLSNFTIMATTCWHEATLLAGKTICRSDWILGTWLPEFALRPECDSNCLIIMNSTVRVKTGTVFRQLSLSRYFQAIHEVCRLPSSYPMEDTTVFYPLRSFSEKSLLMPDGQNLLNRLCALGKCVIIEDVDLDSRHLRKFMQMHNLAHLAATDLTRQLHLTTSNLLCVAEKQYEHLLPGVKLW